MGRRLAVAALLLAGCGSEPAGEPGRFAGVVEDHRREPVEARVAFYLPLAESLDYAEKWPEGTAHLSELVNELLRVRDFAALDGLETGLESVDRRRMIIETVWRHDGDPDVRRMLGRWAEADPEEIALARYRPGGVDFLFERLEDRTASPQDRARCARELYVTGDRSLIPRLRAVADDPTPVPTRGLRAGSGVPTLGEIVQRYIEMFEKP